MLAAVLPARGLEESAGRTGAEKQIPRRYAPRDDSVGQGAANRTGLKRGSYTRS